MRTGARRLPSLLMLVWLVLGFAGHGHAATGTTLPAHDHAVNADQHHAETVADSHHSNEDADRSVRADCPEHSDGQCCCGFGHCVLALPLSGTGHWLTAMASRPKPIAEPPLAAEPPGQPVRPPIG